jgi:uncharacterized lipoprotein NlpE involved in copper resistance
MIETQNHVDADFSAKCADLNNSGEYEPFRADEAVFVPSVEGEGMEIQSDTK